MTIKDKLGREFAVGQWVVRATGKNYYPLEIRSVLRVENGKVYLNSAFPKPLNNPGEVVIIADSNDKLASELESKFK